MDKGTESRGRKAGNSQFSLGVDDASGEPKGRYGKKTRQAVRSWLEV